MGEVYPIGNSQEYSCVTRCRAHQKAMIVHRNGPDLILGWGRGAGGEIGAALSWEERFRSYHSWGNLLITS